MTEIKCSACKALVKLREGQITYKCEYCGTYMSLPVDADGRMNMNALALVERGFFHLQYQEWWQATEKFNQVLNVLPQYAKAYIGKLLAELYLPCEEELLQYRDDLSKHINYANALRFADPEYKKILIRYNRDNLYIYKEREFEQIQSGNVKEHISSMPLPQIYEMYRIYSGLREEFDAFGNYQNAEHYAKICEETVHFLIYRIRLAEDKIEKQEAETKKRQEEQKRIRELRIKKSLKIAAAVACVLIVFITAGVIIKNITEKNEVENINKSAVQAMEAQQYEEAIKIWRTLESTAEIEEQIARAYYEEGGQLLSAGEYMNAVDMFGKIDAEYADDEIVKDAKEKSYEAYYLYGKEFYDRDELYDARVLFRQCISYKDTADYFNQIDQRMHLVAAGSTSAAVLKRDGRVEVEGKLSGHGAGEWKEVVGLSAEFAHIIAWKKDGTVASIGKEEDPACEVNEWEDITMAATGNYHTVGLKRDGTVVACGNNEHGEGDVDGWRDIVSVAAGYSHTVGLKRDGTVVACGENQPDVYDTSVWNDIFLLKAGAKRTVGVKKDGTVLVMEDDFKKTQQIKDAYNTISVVVTSSHILILQGDGTIAAYGEDTITSYLSKMKSYYNNWENVVAVGVFNNKIYGILKDGTAEDVEYDFYRSINSANEFEHVGYYRW